MLNVYNTISPTYGPHIAGICNIKIVPIEWLEAPVEKDFKTDKIITAVEFIDGKSWINLELLQETFEFIEKPKQSKPGSFFEVSISGTSNDITPETLQVLNTFRNHLFIALVKDAQHREKLIGNQHEGMLFQFSNKEANDKGGTQIILIDLNMDLQDPAPFYELP
ncbi:MAG: hypothetical protein V4594_16845 [Bacteroidota bacterium]